ncbi:DUF4190 domain-containing protein [Promicromonospora sp. MS192]|uniref:DUF4190 domain-containing protein n=1 Tax=Promicromonospora sp. MS192 TaxID=3412684 RepID=UPI003C2BA1F6
MTENDGGAPRDPQRDPETPPTQPLPEPASGAEQVPPGATEPGSAGPAGQGPGAPYGQSAPASGYEPPAEASGSEQPAYSEQRTAGTPSEQSGAQGPYGGAPAPQYGYAPAPPKNDLGVWALVTGILSYVMCPLLLGIAAIITGTMSRRAADEGLANNRGMGTAGLILGWINVALFVLVAAFFIVALAAGLLAGGLGEWNDVNDMPRYRDY